MRFLRPVCALLLALLLQATPGLAAERVLLGPSGPARAAADAAIRPLEAKARREGTVRVIVGLRVPFAPAASLDATAARQQAGEIAAAASILQLRYAAAIARAPERFRAYGGIPFAALDVTPAELRALAADPEVISISENLLLRANLAQSTALIRAPEAWTAGDKGRNQVIAIIDTGVESGHPMLAGKVVSEACYSTSRWCPGRSTGATGPGSGAPCPSDYAECRHGTHVAGIAAGRSFSGHSGVAPEAQIISIQVFSEAGTSAGTYLSDVLAALERVHALRASFNIAAVNLSLSFPLLTPQYCDQASRPTTTAFDQLRADGIAVVVASGNDGSSKGIAFPACISSAVSVGSVSDSDWGTCAFSGIAPSSTAADKVACYSNASRALSLLAPGSAITSATTGGYLTTMNGTSMAAPHVAGAFALLRGRTPTATVADMLSALRRTGRAVTDYRDSGIVTPRIDVKAALDTFSNDTDGKVALDLTMAGNGRGRVAFAPAGSFALCTANCSNLYAKGTAVTLTATPEAPATFAGWSGACSGSGPCTVTLAMASAVTASFEGVPSGPPQALSLALAGTGSPGVTLTASGASATCTKSCKPSYPRGSVVTATAAPAPGTEFLSWSGACTGRKTICKIQMNAPQALAARFRQLPVYSLGISLTGNGGGSVVVSVGGRTTRCTANCTVPVAAGSRVKLTAQAASGNSFGGWSGACRGPKTGCTLTVAAPARVSARFD